MVLAHRPVDDETAKKKQAASYGRRGRTQGDARFFFEPFYVQASNRSLSIDSPVQYSSPYLLIPDPVGESLLGESVR